MRTDLRVLLLAAALVLLATLARADDAPSGSWYGRWFGSNKATPKKVGESADDDVDSASAAAGRAAANASSPSASPRARAEAAYHRRDAVCLKLRDIANSTNDQALLQQVEQLEARNWELYRRRTANLNAAVKEK